MIIYKLNPKGVHVKYIIKVNDMIEPNKPKVVYLEKCISLLTKDKIDFNPSKTTVQVNRRKFIITLLLV